MIWAGFIILVLALLALDLGVFHRKAHVIQVREALLWSAFWIFLGLLFGIVVYFIYEYHLLGFGEMVDAVDGQVNDGFDAAIKYYTGYVLEKSLSVDNIFVIAMIFKFMAVPAKFQHRVLFWGITGALVLRGIMIGVGAELVARHHWILYIFGAFLLITAVKMLVIQENQDPGQNFVTRWMRKLFPITDTFHEQRFFVRLDGKLFLTPLALALVLVETTDLIFAVDSIPAIFAITADPFLVFTSNVFAILGLRALYFALAGMIDKFRFLKVSLAAILAMVGLKMLMSEFLKDLFGSGFNLYLLAVIVTILVIGVIASIWTGPAPQHRIENRPDTKPEKR